MARTTATALFSVGDIVDMHCGEQGIVVEILDDTWVHLLQCNGHIDKAHIGDIWLSDKEQNGRAALHELFMKTFGYSSLNEDEYESQEDTVEDAFYPNFEVEEDIPF